MSYLMALDQGTSSSRCLVFDLQGRIVAQAQREFAQHYPQPGWVEHAPQDLWQTQLACAQQALQQAGIGADAVLALGITNQRETTVLWDRQTGQPIHPAIVWQDRRTESLCRELRDQGLAEQVQRTTGLVIDPYFSGTKIRWLLDHVPGARQAAEAGRLAFGTVDTWLLWQLTGGQVHATDVSNAARTLLFDIHRQTWDATLLAQLDIPISLMPEVRPSSHLYGHSLPGWFGRAIPIAGMAGDQQAALFGQACFEQGLAKNTYGTGCFMLTHTGERALHSQHGLLCTRAASGGGSAGYALEGSVFIGGAVVQWLRDGLQAIAHSGEVEALAASVPDTGGVHLVPAFTGLGAPYWDAEARGALLGLTRGTTQAHIARAALESIAFQSAALLQAMAADLAASGGGAIRALRVDGGACVNSALMQFQADLLGLPIERPAVTETTALGAAYLAGLGVGVWSGAAELAGHWRMERRFEPQMSRDEAQARMAGWERAVRQVRCA